MSTQPEENDIEIEEGEIISDEEEELSMTEDEEEQLEDFEDEEGESVDIAELMTSLMATEDGDTVCSALVNIGNQLQIQNKILIKMLSKVNSA
jgi:hypothetical protein